MKKEYILEVLLKNDEMSKFLIRHTYSRPGGVFGVILSLVSLVGLIAFWGKLVLVQKVALIFLALTFTVIQPVSLWRKGRKQLKQESFQKPFVYQFNNEGVKVSQDEFHQEFGWDQIRKVVVAKDAIYVYMTAMSAFILPRRICSEDYVDLAKMLREKTK